MRYPMQERQQGDFAKFNTKKNASVCCCGRLKRKKRPPAIDYIAEPIYHPRAMCRDC